MKILKPENLETVPCIKELVFSRDCEQVDEVATPHRKKARLQELSPASASKSSQSLGSNELSPPSQKALVEFRETVSAVPALPEASYAELPVSTSLATTPLQKLDRKGGPGGPRGIPAKSRLVAAKSRKRCW